MRIPTIPGLDVNVEVFLDTSPDAVLDMEKKYYTEAEGWYRMLYSKTVDNVYIVIFYRYVKGNYKLIPDR